MGDRFVTLEEQGLRDGLQTLPVHIPVQQKLKWIETLVDAGLKHIQVTSFVHPKLVPQMADAAELCDALPKVPGVTYSALVLNEKGVERAAEAGLKHLSVSLSASDTHSRKNSGKGLQEAKAEFKKMVTTAQSAGIKIRGGIQCAFGCRYEGVIAEDVVYDLVQHHLECGANELALADSTGMGNPVQIKRMMQPIKQLAADTTIALHLHNTENKGYANLCAALDAGIRHFDTAFGGLGGCPFIQGATGNIATEDTVHLLGNMGFETNIDMRSVAAVSREMETLLGKPLPGLLYHLLNNPGIKII